MPTVLQLALMKKLLPILGLFALIRLGLIPLFELFPQEAYYFFYSQNPSLSYFDHPPMVALLIGLSTSLLGPSVWGIRLGALVYTFLTQILFYKTARLLLDEQSSQRITLIMAATIMVSTLSLISTPDVALVLTWCGTLYALVQAIFKDRKVFWILAGICMGLAFDSKYTGAALQIGLLLFLVTSTTYRKLLLTPYPYLSLVLAQLVMAPVYIWNMQHDWASFAFQSTTHTKSALSFRPQYLLALLATQAALVGPPLLVLFFRWIGATTSQMVRSRRPLMVLTEQQLFLVLFFVPLFLGFFALSLTSLVKPNWIMPAYLSGMILVAPMLSERFMKAQVAFVVVLHLLAIVYLGTLFYPIKSDDTCIGWKALGERVEQELTVQPELFVFAADGYKTSAELRFYTGREIFSENILGNPALHFDFIGTDTDALIGRDALFIDSDPHLSTQGKKGSVEPLVEQKFNSVEELDPLIVTNRFGIQRIFHLYRCRGYLGAKA